MAKRSPASDNQAAAYRREATTRIIALSAAFVVSVIAGLAVAAALLLFFPHKSGHIRDNIFGYGFTAVFVIVCSVLVYEADKRLNRKFSQNP